ncbi:MAG: biotin--[acetyl-CoA-carboxylase] ligase [Acidobacteria bacterium]|nr:biotin--[acetyl-CoA-carboxylase] ligase [Acidobacteriota bacterium]
MSSQPSTPLVVPPVGSSAVPSSAHSEAPLDQAQLRAALVGQDRVLNRLDVVESTGSTNADLVAAAAAWPHLGALLAESQTAGRGRLDRDWKVAQGSSLIMSFVLRAEGDHALPPTALSWISPLAGVALVDTLRSLAGVNAALKWPNDVLIEGHKVAGILAHLVPTSSYQAPGAQQAQPQQAQPQGSGPTVVLGIGLNVSQERSQLPVGHATSLALAGATELDRNVLFADFARRFTGLYQEFCDVQGSVHAPLGAGESLHQRTTLVLATLGLPVRAELPGGGLIRGVAAGLAEDGSLLITDSAGTSHSVRAGDVVHLRRDAAADPGSDGNSYVPGHSGASAGEARGSYA